MRRVIAGVVLFVVCGGCGDGGKRVARPDELTLSIIGGRQQTGRVTGYLVPPASYHRRQ